MNTEMKDTSLDSFEEIRNGVREKRAIQVYNMIKKMGSCSNSMIARELRLSINKITGRTNELRNYYKVVGFSHKALCLVTNRTVNFWKVVRDFDEWDKRRVEDE